ncbi:MAG: GNAT family N-acetyltransferase [Reichenbachiella sp.]|uniref:GNAT family N-acetyltransferase n=1 Tax=Reichenbachiella sp. TaxID=2184521 RepID=UPI003263AE97
MSNKPEYHIRAVEKDDMNDLIQLCADHAAYEDASFDQSGKVDTLANNLFGQEPPLLCHVVSDGDTLLGYVTFMRQFSTWHASFYVYMDCLFLRPEARNAGLGKRLMAAVVDYAKANRCREIQWQTPNTNAGAIRFYKKNGAEPKSKVRFFQSVS